MNPSNMLPPLPRFPEGQKQTNEKQANMRGRKKSSLNSREQFGRKLSQDSSQFSFSKSPLQTQKMSIRSDLYKLPKQDIVQILLQQIQQTKVLRLKLASVQDQIKIMQSFREQSYCQNHYGNNNANNFHQAVSMAKYKQLADYMQQYIANTNQAQDHFINLINQLKSNNKKLKQENSKLQNNICQMLREKNQQNNYVDDYNKDKIQQLEKTIKDLQDSVAHYMNINNQHTRKYEKLKKMYQVMEQQLQTAMHSEDRHKDRNHSSFENEREILMQSKKVNNRMPCQSRSKNQGLKQKENLEQKVKILQIQNYELKQSYSAMQRALQNKSQKIRKLLQDIQRLSEQKWILKEKYMELKSKSLLITTQSNSKNYDFDSQAHNDTHIADFNLLSK